MKNAARWIVCLAIGAGCVEQPTQRGRGGVSSQELEAVRRRVARRQAPTPEHPLSISFGGGKVELIGYNVNATELHPGQRATVTWYWKCNTPPGEGWRLFTHLDDAARPRTNRDEVGEVRTGYQPERWRAGEFITDTQEFELPGDWDSPVVRFHVGLWKGDQRMPAGPPEMTDRDPTSPRARVFELRTGVQIQVAETQVSRLSGAIAVDGRLDEPAWANAPRISLVNPGSGDPATPTDAQASARMLWDDNNLYVGFDVQDRNLVDVSEQRDDHLWEHDTVEVMVDPDGDGQNYFEFQVSPRNRRFDTRYDSARRPSEPTPGHIDYNPETQSGVVVTGTIGSPDDEDTGYAVEFAIPWTALAPGLAHTPPQLNDTVRLNLFVMDEDKQGGHRSAAWSAPRSGDFHTLERFGRITLVGEAPTGVVVQPAAAAPSAAPSAAQPAQAVGPAARQRVLPNVINPSAIPALRAH